MKIWNLVVILAISCLLPILAQKQDNAIDTAGSICENELGQFCIDKNDTHKCMFPLAKPECPAGKQCCNTFPKDYDSAGLLLTKAKKCTKKCPCCVAGVDKKMTNLESAMEGMTDTMENMESTLNSTQEVLDSQPTRNELQLMIESNFVDSESLNTMLNTTLSEMTRDINGVDEKMTNLESAVEAELIEIKQLVESLASSNQEIKQSVGQIKDIVETSLNCTEAKSCVPPFYKVHGVGCIHYVSDRLNWMDARSGCQSIGGDLFVASDVNNFLEFSKYTKHYSIYTVQEFWIGIKSRAWLNGRQVTDGEWGPGEPDNNPDDCGGAGVYRDFLAWDYPCNWAGPSVCQQSN